MTNRFPPGYIERGRVPRGVPAPHADGPQLVRTEQIAEFSALLDLIAAKQNGTATHDSAIETEMLSRFYSSCARPQAGARRDARDEAGPAAR